MELQTGKTYRDEHGNRVGPLKGRMFKWVDGKGHGPDAEWGNDGKVRMRGPEGYGDLIAEWTDGPVHTITRREIVRGQYADVDVGEQLEIPDCNNPDLTPVRKVAVAYAGFRSSAELKAAAAVLLELAGALE